jgi:hypothetical protein
MDRHTQVCGVRIIDQSPPSIYLSTGAYPVEFTSPANPGTAGETQVSSGRVAYWRACYTVAHLLRQPGFRGPIDPYIVRGSPH